jgi:hypothetical protein
MRTRLPLSLAATGLLVLLAGCGLGASAGANSSPPTSSGGPVSVAIDHSQYGGSEGIKVTVTNSLGSAIYAYDTRASCSILSLETQSGGSWGPASVAHCPLGRAAMLVKIAAGASYNATTQASIPGVNSATFPTGSYRLVLQYYTSATPGTSAGTPVYSVSLSITGSGASGAGQSGIPSSSGISSPPKKP